MFKFCFFEKVEASFELSINLNHLADLKCQTFISLNMKRENILFATTNPDSSDHVGFSCFVT